MYTLGDVVGDPRFVGTEVTVKCRVDGQPFKQHGRTHFPIENIGVPINKDCYATFWHETEEVPVEQEMDHINFSGTESTILELIEEQPPLDGEELLVRGTVREGDTLGWHVNVTSLFLRNPSTLIGKSEMRTGRNECPRIYDLIYNKNVISSPRFGAGSLKGRIVHRVLERAISDPEFRSLFEEGWTEDPLNHLLDAVLDEDFGFEIALGHLAWSDDKVRTVKAWAIDALRTLFYDDDFCSRITNATDEELETERALSDGTGLRGRVDFLIDGTPFDLKTSRKKWDKHEFQIKIYLFGLLLERLEPGDDIHDSLESLSKGQILYTSLRDEDDLVTETFELTYQDIEDILTLRNDVVTYRTVAAGSTNRGFGLPTTYDRNCDGCQFKEPDYLIGDPNVDQPDLPSACQYYCQSERRWPCQEFKDDGTVDTRCPLYERCDQRLEFRDPKRTDHFNELRSAINTERSVQSNAVRLFESLEPETLITSGLKLTGLVPSETWGDTVAYKAPSDVFPGFSSGTKVTLTAPEVGIETTATYYGQDQDTYWFKFEGSPAKEFRDPSTSLQANQAFSMDSSLRDQLQYLDFAQRSEDTFAPVLLASGDASGEVSITDDSDAKLCDPDSLAEITEEFGSSCELLVNLPVRTDRVTLLARLLTTVVDADFETATGEVKSGSESRTLVLTNSRQQLDRISPAFHDRDDVMTIDESTPRNVSREAGHRDPTTFRDDLLGASAVLSTTGYALGSRTFQKITEANDGRFFDAIVLLGAETLTEPEYLFLDYLAEGTVAIGDIHRPGPQFVSKEARVSNLSDSYFERAFQRYRSLEAANTQCFQFEAETSEDRSLLLQRTAHPADERLSGSLNFEHVSGEEELPTEQLLFRHQVMPEEGQETYKVRLRLADGSNALSVPASLESVQQFNPTQIHIGEVLTLGEQQFEVVSYTPDDADHHQLVAQAPIEQTSFFTRRLLRNSDEVDRIVELATEENPDVIVTPFYAQANEIRKEIAKKELSVPVKLPSELPNQPFDSGILSTVTANREARIAPPLDSGDTLYTLLTAADELTIVGDRSTLRQNQLLRELFEWE